MGELCPEQAEIMNRAVFNYITTFDEFQEWWKQLREEMANWLNKFDWDWWATFTFRYAVVNPYNAGRYFDAFFKPYNVNYFYACEWFQFGTNLHIHALMSKCKHLRRLTIMDEWYKKYGIARIYPYLREKGARYYLCKYVVKEIADWNFKITDESQLEFGKVTEKKNENPS